MPMKHAFLCVGFIALLTLPRPAIAAEPGVCPACAAWNLPQEPFRIHGDTYYVGTQGLSSILVTSDDGHVLIDGGLPESAQRIVANIEMLGFRVEDIELLLNSHVHFDHAGGIAELQRLSGARVAASAWSEVAMREGRLMRGDPQFDIGIAVAAVSGTVVIDDMDTLVVGPTEMTAHFTPGHTPGGTSWAWQSCEAGECLDIVYADSLMAVSADDFYFTRSSDYPGAVADFEMSFTRLENLPCDILLSPHPGFADLFAARERQQNDDDPSTFIDSDACKNYAGAMREVLDQRITREIAEPQ